MVKLDNVIMSSFHESFKNREKITASLNLPSNVVADGDGREYFQTVAFTRSGSVTETYYERSGGTYRYKAESSYVLQEFVGPGDDPTIQLSNDEPDQLLIRISYANFTAGTPINTTAQTYNFVIYVFDTPFS